MVCCHRAVRNYGSPKCLVEADDEEVIETPLVDVSRDESLDDGAQGRPRDLGQRGDRRLVHLAGEPGNQALEIEGEQRLRRRPRHCLVDDAVFGARDAVPMRFHCLDQFMSPHPL